MEKRLRIAVAFLVLLVVLLAVFCINLVTYNRSRQERLDSRFQENFHELCGDLFARENSEEDLLLLRGNYETCLELLPLTTYFESDGMNDLVLSLHKFTYPAEMQLLSEDMRADMFNTLDRLALELNILDPDDISERVDAALELTA